MNLRDQISEIASRRFGSAFVSATTWPTQVNELAAIAFAERWEIEVGREQDCKAIRKAYLLLKNVGWVTADEPGVY